MALAENEQSYRSAHPRKAKQGTKVVYLPGNHDKMLREYVGTQYNGIEIRNEVIHRTVDGRRYLVLHGDRFDCVVQKSLWLAQVGSVLYERLLGINRYYNHLRRLLGTDYYSLSAYLKQKCKKAVNYIGDFEGSLLTEIERQKVDGIVCGHIHKAAIKMMGNSLYTNSGDWVESCTALAENRNGTFGIIDWMEYCPVSDLALQEEYEKDRYRDGCLAPTN